MCIECKADPWFEGIRFVTFFFVFHCRIVCVLVLGFAVCVYLLFVPAHYSHVHPSSVCFVEVQSPHADS